VVLDEYEPDLITVCPPDKMRKRMKFFTSLETYFYGLLGMITGFIVPVGHFLALCGGLILLDTITGIRAARKRGDKINSRSASRMIDKVVVYAAAILACHGVQLALKIPVSMTYFAVGAIAFTELLSILENTRVVSGANIGGVIKQFIPQNIQPVEEDEPEDEFEK
jgi:phage-related holin